MAADHPGGLTREHVIWAYRLLLDRDPESDDVIGPKLAGSHTTRELRHHLITSGEFVAKNPDFARTNERTIVIKEIAPGLRLFIDLSDHTIGLNILRGHYEQDEIHFVRRTLRAGDAAVDVGGHIGFFTIHMAAAVGPHGQVYAFEPLDGNADLLEQSIVENRFSDRVSFRRAAVAAAPGIATLTFPAETLNSGGAYLLRDGHAPLTGNLKKEVPLVSLDSLDLRRPIRFIKMDVEGAEPQVLRGATRILTEDKPVILSELHPTQLERASGITPDQFLAQIHAFGYGAHRVENGEVGAAIEHAPPDALVSIALVPRS